MRPEIICLKVEEMQKEKKEKKTRTSKLTRGRIEHGPFN